MTVAVPVYNGARFLARTLESLLAQTHESFEIVGHSRSANDFTITKTNGGAPVRTCTTGGTGGCPETGATDNW